MSDNLLGLEVKNLEGEAGNAKCFSTGLTLTYCFNFIS